uniref:Chromosome 2 open reading frame 68 n=1 Tax=Equus asinus TaxID=9793 RepID=A0A9L0JXE7_EQUAS
GRCGGGGGSARWVPNGSGAGSQAGALLQAWRAAGHESRLRAPYPKEPARPVPPRPAPPPPAWPGPAVPDSRSAPRRDDYDKKVKQAAKEKARRRHTPAPTRPRKPDLQVYLPRRRDVSTHPSNPDCEESGESSSSGGSEPEPSGHQLFCLEYEADSGEVTSVIVYQDDDPERVSEEVSTHTPLDPPMREALKLRIQEEIAKRQSRH